MDGTVALGAGVIEADLIGGGLRSSSLVAAADVGVRWHSGSARPPPLKLRAQGLAQQGDPFGRLRVDTATSAITDEPWNAVIPPLKVVTTVEPG
jgi:hypothetical protein